MADPNRLTRFLLTVTTVLAVVYAYVAWRLGSQVWDRLALLVPFVLVWRSLICAILKPPRSSCIHAVDIPIVDLRHRWIAARAHRRRNACAERSARLRPQHTRALRAEGRRADEDARGGPHRTHWRPGRWLIKRAPDRVVAAVLSQPVGFRKEMPRLAYDSYMKSWAPALMKSRPDITLEMIERFLTAKYLTNPDFVFTVTRDFVRSCQTPILVMPDDIPSHPFAIAMESVMLAPKSEVTMYPWKEPPDRIPVAVRQVRSFLRAHRPVTA